MSSALQLSSLTTTTPVRAARIKKAKTEASATSILLTGCRLPANFAKNNSAYDMMPKLKFVCAAPLQFRRDRT
jgi:hypothetical protein